MTSTTYIFRVFHHKSSLDADYTDLIQNLRQSRHGNGAKKYSEKATSPNKQKEEKKSTDLIQNLRESRHHGAAHVQPALEVSTKAELQELGEPRVSLLAPHASGIEFRRDQLQVVVRVSVRWVTTTVQH